MAHSLSLASISFEFSADCPAALISHAGKSVHYVSRVPAIGEEIDIDGFALIVTGVRQYARSANEQAPLMALCRVRPV